MNKEILKKVLKNLLIVSSIMMFIMSCGRQGKDGVSNSKDELSKNNRNSSDKIMVTTTTTMLTDLVRVIGGDKVEVTGLMGEGVDPHLYSASAGDIDKLSNADIIVYGGLHLEGKMQEIFEQLEKQNKTILNVGDKIDKNKITFEEGNVPDPHVWFDVDLWIIEAQAVTDKLIEFDAQNKNYYTQNFENYKKELAELKEYIKNRISEIPKNSRVLVTAHDAFGYYGKAFGLEVKAIQGVSTDSETGTKNINDLANFIVERNIKSIFVESSVPKKSIEALQEAVKAKGKNVSIGGELYSDSLGDVESGTETYIKTVKANTDTIVNALK